MSKVLNFAFSVTLLMFSFISAEYLVDKYPELQQVIANPFLLVLMLGIGILTTLVLTLRAISGNTSSNEKMCNAFIEAGKSTWSSFGWAIKTLWYISYISILGYAAVLIEMWAIDYWLLDYRGDLGVFLGLIVGWFLLVFIGLIITKFVKSFITACQ